MKKFFRGMASNFSAVGELLSYMWQNKMYLIIPMVVVLLLFGLLLIFATSSGLGPFLYTLF